MTDIIVKPQALTAAAFAPYGDVIETSGRTAHWINAGTCERFDDLADLDVLAEAGRPLISIFKATARSLPLRVETLERHPLSSQAFYPLDRLPFMVVVASRDGAPVHNRIRAFYSSGDQGVNYRRNTWHHALIALERTSRFLVVDRGGPGDNCEQLPVNGAVVLVANP